MVLPQRTPANPFGQSLLSNGLYEHSDNVFSPPVHVKPVSTAAAEPEKNWLEYSDLPPLFKKKNF